MSAHTGGRRRGPRRVLRLRRSPFEPAVLLRLAVAALALFVVALVVGLVVGTGEPPAFDARLVEAGTLPAGTAGSTAAATLGRIGHLVVVAPIAAATALFARWRSGGWDLALLLLTVLGGATVLTGVLKLAIDRPRPAGGVVSALSAAYPSGHAVRAAAVFGLVAWLVRYWSERPLVRSLTVPVAAVVVAVNGAARVLLGVHWPSDVLVGATLGTAWLLVCWRLLQPSSVRPT